MRAARKQIETPFAVINADDFYGRDAYAKLAAYFKQSMGQPELQTCMVGYPLRNTLSEHGSVNRGLCRVEDGVLGESKSTPKFRRLRKAPPRGKI